MTSPPPRRWRAAIITDGDACDLRTWSGIPAHMMPALEAQFDLVHVERRPFSDMYWRLRSAILRRSNGAVDLAWLPIAARMASGAARRRVRQSKPDIVFVIAQSPLCVLLARHLRTVNLSDTTASSIVNYYPEFARLRSGLRRQIVKTSRDAVRSAFLNIYPSQWAARSAIDDEGADPSRVAVVAWGANFATMPTGKDRHLDAPLRLLFVGFDWRRKGGDDVVAAIEMLRQRGIAARLDVVSGKPPHAPDDPAIYWHGALDKRDPTAFRLLQSLYDDAHLFVLPSRSECFGIVFAEAAAYGIPSIALDTGGVSSAVRNGETGLLLPPGSGPETLTDALAALAGDPVRYAEMSRAARADSRDRLDWKIWAAGVRDVVDLAMACNHMRKR